VRCSDGKSGNMDKVLVCHKTSSTKNPTEQICIASSAVADHLNKHGDYLGTCGSTYTCGGSSAAPINNGDLIDGYSIGLKPNLLVYPNPFSSSTNLMFSVPEDQKVSVEVFTLTGQKLATVFNDVLVANQALIMGFNPDNYSYGTFVVRMVTEKGGTLQTSIIRIRN